MPLILGNPAPPIAGTDVVSNQPWSLEDHADKMVLLAFSGITWCAPCQLEAPALEAVWQLLQGNKSFTMAIISGRFSDAEDPKSLQSAIAKFGITFPVVPGHNSWPEYAIDSVPTLYCLRWDTGNNRYVVHGVHVGSLTQEEDILDFLKDCGLTESEQPPLMVGHWEAVFIHLFGGVIFGGGGWGVTAGGKPIPIPPPTPLRHLGSAGRDALMGLAIAEMASRFGNSGLRKRVYEAGIGTAKAAILRLEPRRARLARGGVSVEPAAWGSDRVPTPDNTG